MSTPIHFSSVHALPLPLLGPLALALARDLDRGEEDARPLLEEVFRAVAAQAQGESRR